MSLSNLLPKLDNAGRRLILAEILGEPVGLRLAKQARSIKSRQHNDQPVPHLKTIINSNPKAQQKEQSIVPTKGED